MNKAILAQMKKMNATEFCYEVEGAKQIVHVSGGNIYAYTFNKPSAMKFTAGFLGDDDLLWNAALPAMGYEARGATIIDAQSNLHELFHEQYQETVLSAEKELSLHDKEYKKRLVNFVAALEVKPLQRKKKEGVVYTKREFNRLWEIDRKDGGTLIKEEDCIACCEAWNVKLPSKGKYNNIWYLAAKEAGCDGCEEVNADNDLGF